MNLSQDYKIGTPGEKWGELEEEIWRSFQKVKRSYELSVLTELTKIDNSLQLVEYGKLSYPPHDYSLFAIKSKNWDRKLPNILITGGVHGYETSGVHGAMRFANLNLKEYRNLYNFVIIPCVSPWGYETINRWNPNAVDPNRSFYTDSPSVEANLLMEYISSLDVQFIAHIDLHETTDSDNSEFRPALAARDAIEQKNWNIPDGFYLVGDNEKPADAFQKAIINKVETVTHIAPADDQQRLIGVPLAQFGVINYTARELGLCMGLTGAPYVTTTEVYPNSPLVNDEECISAQVSAITGALEYLNSL